jgi:hypothetical protein
VSELVSHVEQSIRARRLLHPEQQGRTGIDVASPPHELAIAQERMRDWLRRNER